MHKYVIKRLLYMIPVLLGVAFLVFTILSLTPSSAMTSRSWSVFLTKSAISFSISVWEPPIRPASR